MPLWVPYYYIVCVAISASSGRSAAPLSRTITRIPNSSDSFGLVLVTTIKSEPPAAARAWETTRGHFSSDRCMNPTVRHHDSLKATISVSRRNGCHLNRSCYSSLPHSRRRHLRYRAQKRAKPRHIRQALHARLQRDVFSFCRRHQHRERMSVHYFGTSGLRPPHHRITLVNS
jgi:hypothetical protein